MSTADDVSILISHPRAIALTVIGYKYATRSYYVQYVAAHLHFDTFAPLLLESGSIEAKQTNEGSDAPLLERLERRATVCARRAHRFCWKLKRRVSSPFMQALLSTIIGSL